MAMTKTMTVLSAHMFSTTFTECVFEKGYYLDLSALAANAKITLKDCVW